MMSISEEILIELKTMSDAQRAQGLDFARFLRQKEAREIEALAENIIEENMEALKELAK